MSAEQETAMLDQRDRSGASPVDQAVARRAARNAETVQATYTPRRRTKRPRHYVETMEFIGAARRFIRAAGRRAADGDEPELAELLKLQDDLNEAFATAVHGQRAIGRSWAHIARATGKTRGAAFQRWGGNE